MAIHQFVVGCSLHFSAIFLAQVRRLPSSDIAVNHQQASWIASGPFLMCPVGLVIIGVLADKIGRRKALQVSYIPLVLGWIILAYAENLNAIIAGRIILGFSLGAGTCVYLYLAEVCPAVHRPLFFGLITVAVALGTYTMPAMAVDYDWRTLSLMNVVLSITGVLALFAVPESPMWQWHAGLDQEAKATERWWGMANMLPTCTVVKVSSGSIAWTSKSVWKPALHAMIFFACQQGTGVYVLVSYTVDALRDYRVPSDTITITTWLSVARIAGSALYAFLYTVNRKTLTVISSLGMFVAMSIVMGYTCIVQDIPESPSYGKFILPPAFILYFFFGVLGTIPLPWAMCGELFPMGVKGTMTGLVYSCGFFGMLLAIQIYPMLVSASGIMSVWSFFCVFCLITAAYGAFFMPETKGKSLDEVLRYFEDPQERIERGSNKR
ncbi:facilitated trehalose transporter Tret1-like isoform X2 [Daktulosphaira vitifoliae]|nr:facilitated trehalose transporter Tret1-like isoform X2 [Daktulosphaira vitifoliae]